MSRQSASKRAYLAKEDRRMALLDVAASVVEQQGWPALSMIAVAETAKVSRQLVYQHFTSVDELMADTMEHLFRNRYEHIRRSIANPSNDLVELVQIADRQTFDDPPARVRALWQMITATHSDNAETARMGTRVRHLLIKLWSPTISRQFGLNDSQGRAVAWMLNMAFWGIYQLVDEGEISRRTAVDLFSWMLTRLQGKPTPAPAPPAASRSPASARPRARRPGGAKPLPPA